MSDGLEAEPRPKGELEEKPPLKINIAPVGGMVHVTLSEAVKEFDVDPYAALSIGNSFQDASVIARVNAMLEHERLQHKS